MSKLRDLNKRTMDALREQGYYPWKVEFFDFYAQKTRDLWNTVDVLAIRKNEVLGVQITSRDNISSRAHKIADHEATPWIRDAGIRLEIWGWDRQENGRYRVKIVDVS